MINEAIFFAVLTCAPTQVDNRVEVTNSLEEIKDVDALITAKRRCGEIYEGSPCVKRFIIKLDDWGDRMYSVVCGAKDYKKPSIWQD